MTIAMGSLQGVSGSAGAGTAAAGNDLTQKKLTDAAQQFEAMFLQEMLKPMRSGKEDGMGEEDKDATPGSDTMSSYGTEAVASAIAKGGGMGIAKAILAKVNLERQQHAERNVKES